MLKLLYLEWSFAVMLVDDAESANDGSNGTNLWGHIDEKLVLIDESVVTASG